MYSQQQLLEMITSDKPSQRYDACEWIRISQESCPDYIYALQKASHDENVEVASRAALALQADVHHDLAVKLGLVKPDPVVGLDTASVEPNRVASQTTTGDSGALSVQASAIAPPGIASMLREIRSWAYWSIGLGVLHFIASGTLNAPWGILLIVVGLMSFIFRSASMFVIYGVTLAWAAVSNLMSLQIPWAFMAAIQVYFTVRVIMAYHQHYKNEVAYLASDAVEPAAKKPTLRTSRLFPWVGALVACLAMVGYVVFIFVIFVLAIATQGNLTLPAYVDFIDATLVNLGVLGFAMGLASILSKYHPRALGIIALVAGILTLLIFLALLLLARIA